MRRHDINLTSLILRTFILVQLTPIVFSCIYLLNGWMPMPVYNRTEKADIVLSAHVVKTYKDKIHRTAAQTYTATVKLFDVYKGEKLLRNIPVNAHAPNIYNISNFGDRKMCYADIMEGKNYILFLTTYKQRLSAKYDDIFGASTKFTEKNVRDVMAQVGSGLSDWSTWSACSQSCEGGYQIRKRECKTASENCAKKAMDKRSCNKFHCEGIHDLLSYLGVYKLPLGVRHVHNRPGAFNISRRAKLYALFTEVYPQYLPHDFSLMMSINFGSNFTGYFFTLSDLMGMQRLALKYIKKDTKSTILFEYYDNEDLPGSKSPEFEFEIADNFWHQFGFVVDGEKAELYLDCEMVLEKDFPRADESTVGSNLMMSLGPYFARYGTTFVGGIEQLVITEDTQAAAQQCLKVFDDTERAIKDEGNKQVDNTSLSDRPTKRKHRKHKSTTPAPATTISTPVDMPTQWTEWSPCSRTCGRGVQARTLYCGNNVISNCVHSGLNSEESRWCFPGPCSVPCRPACENGGTCSKTGICTCSLGYTGPSCSTALCIPQCSNGGRCISPGNCACPTGYRGRLCEKAVCSPRCANGGRCVQPGFCSCPYGYMPPSCEPVCVLPCRNGGTCVRHNRCRCPRGYTGKDCSTPICRRGCFNGGRCVAPNTCSCPSGFGGSRCHKPICLPPCQNSGKCLYPGFCQCRRGYGGKLCENLVCKRPCRNGGVCTGHNQCSCPKAYRGRWCHKRRRKRKCQTTCYNGGKCRKKRCRCRKGFTGARCEKRECTYMTYLTPYKETHRKLERMEVSTLCGPWQWRTCVQTRFRYSLSSRTLYRVAYKCV